jgi:hypothetical protein
MRASSAFIGGLAALFIGSGCQTGSKDSKTAEAPPPTPAVETATAKPVGDKADGPFTRFVHTMGEKVQLATAQYSLERNRMRGYSAYRNGRPRDGAVYFLACLQQRPDDLKSHYYLGLIALDTYRDPVYARRHLEQAFAQEAKRIKKIENGKIIYKKYHDTNIPWPGYDAIADATAKAIRLTNDKTGLYQFLDGTIAKRGNADDFIRKGRVVHLLRDVDTAQAAYHKALELADRSDPKPYLAMAKFYQAINHRDREVTYLRIVLYLDYDNKHVANRFSQLDIVKGRTLALKPPPKPRKRIRRGPDLPNVDRSLLPGRS